MYLTDEEQDRIEFIEEFPEAPRDDLIARYLYHFTTSNGLVCICVQEMYSIGNDLNCLRSYEEARIYPNFTNKISKKLVFSHLAVFDDYIRLGDNGVFEVDYLASCLTFTSQNRVPAGKLYSVR